MRTVLVRVQPPQPSLVSCAVRRRLGAACDDFLRGSRMGCRLCPIGRAHLSESTSSRGTRSDLNEGTTRLVSEVSWIVPQSRTVAFASGRNARSNQKLPPLSSDTRRDVIDERIRSYRDVPL